MVFCMFQLDFSPTTPTSLHTTDTAARERVGGRYNTTIGHPPHLLGFLVGAGLDLLPAEVVVAVLVHLHGGHRSPVLALVETATESFSRLGEKVSLELCS